MDMLGRLVLSISALAPVMLMGGCMKWYRYDDVRMRVVHAESGAPMSGATVRVSDGYIPRIISPTNSPRPDEGVTDADGNVELRTCTNALAVYIEVVPAGEPAPPFPQYRIVREQLESAKTQDLILTPARTDYFMDTASSPSQPALASWPTITISREHN